MTEFLNLLLQNSLSGTVLILIVLIFRKITGNLSKLYVRVLWLMAFLVLLIPPATLGSLRTVRNVLLQTELARSERTEAVDEAETELDAESGPEVIMSEEFMGQPGNGMAQAGPETKSAYTEILFILWALGVSTLTAGCLIQWIYLKKRTAKAIRIRRDVWSTEVTDIPFVMPGVPSRIYIPKELEKDEDQLEDILKHERRHIRNWDPWIKCFTVLVLILHWFNPFVYLAFRLMNRDMEMYCDECVLRGKSMAEKKHYAQTLLDFACKSRRFSPILYFGESNTKSRIRHVLNIRRPHMIISIFLIIFISGCGLSFLTAGEKETVRAAIAGSQQEQLLEHMEPDREENWTDKAVVGSGHEGMKLDFDEADISLVRETEHFAFYSVHEGEAMAVKTPECMVYAEVPITSSYETAPLIQEQDFDGDGEEELAIITYVLHGTGISIRSIFMADHAGDNLWKIYQYMDNEYIEELTAHFDTRYTEEGVRLIFDGVPTGTAEQMDQEELDNEYAYYAGSQIDFRFVEERIILRAELAGYSKINHAGEYAGHELDAEVHYLGEGRWELVNIHYVDAGIIEVIENAVPLYLAGETDQFNEYYMVPGIQLPDFGEISEKVVILSIDCPAQELESGETEAYVTIRRDDSDSFDYLLIPMKKVPLDFGGTWWRISGEIMMEK